MSLKTFFEKVFPFLFNAVERAYDGLTQAQKNALLLGGQFGQLLKTCLTEGYSALVDKAASELNLTQAQVDDLLTALAKKLNINISAPSELIDKLQAQVNAGMEDSSWDALWTTVSGQLAIIIGGGAINWPTLALGLLEFVYQKFIQPKLKTAA